MMRSSRLHAVVVPLLALIAGSAWSQGNGQELRPGPNNAITDVPGISVGHFTGSDAGTTVVLAAWPAASRSAAARPARARPT
jgi:hypothetical protein